MGLKAGGKEERRKGGKGERGKGGKARRKTKERYAVVCRSLYD